MGRMLSLGAESGPAVKPLHAYIARVEEYGTEIENGLWGLDVMYYRKPPLARRYAEGHSVQKLTKMSVWYYVFLFSFFFVGNLSGVTLFLTPLDVGYRIEMAPARLSCETPRLGCRGSLCPP